MLDMSELSRRFQTLIRSIPDYPGDLTVLCTAYPKKKIIFFYSPKLSHMYWRGLINNRWARVLLFGFYLPFL